MACSSCYQSYRDCKCAGPAKPKDCTRRAYNVRLSNRTAVCNSAIVGGTGQGKGAYTPIPTSLFNPDTASQFRMFDAPAGSAPVDQEWEVPACCNASDCAKGRKRCNGTMVTINGAGAGGGGGGAAALADGNFTGAGGGPGYASGPMYLLVQPHSIMRLVVGRGGAGGEAGQGGSPGQAGATGEHTTLYYRPVGIPDDVAIIWEPGTGGAGPASIASPPGQPGEMGAFNIPSINGEAGDVGTELTADYTMLAATLGPNFFYAEPQARGGASALSAPPLYYSAAPGAIPAPPPGTVWPDFAYDCIGLRGAWGGGGGYGGNFASTKDAAGRWIVDTTRTRACEGGAGSDGFISVQFTPA